MSDGIRCVMVGPVVARIRVKAKRVWHKSDQYGRRDVVSSSSSYRIPNDSENIHGFQR